MIPKAQVWLSYIPDQFSLHSVRVGVEVLWMPPSKQDLSFPPPVKMLLVNNRELFAIEFKQ